jgi:inosose dehydratase
MKAGINVWTWGTQSVEAFEQGVREVADIGYQAIENLGAALTLYEDAPHEFDDLMASHGVECACAYQHLGPDWEADLAMVQRVLRFLQAHAVPIMNLQAAGRPEGGPTEAELADTARKAAQIGKLAGRYGVTVCLHPHYATNVERADELAYVLEHVDPALLSLTLDTAHTVLGGMDPVATFAQYADRVRYVHMKDILPVADPDAPWWSGFRELGRGIVNFPAIVDILRQAGFDGVLCVELDRPRVCGYKSAAISMQYMREELGV